MSANPARVSNENTAVPNDLESWWMPFTANRQFKANPRLLVGAKDMHYTTHDGRQVLDGAAGLWCVNAGHCRQPIVDAIQKQAAEMDFAPTFCALLGAGLPGADGAPIRELLATSTISTTSAGGCAPSPTRATGSSSTRRRTWRWR